MHKDTAPLNSLLYVYLVAVFYAHALGCICLAATVAFEDESKASCAQQAVRQGKVLIQQNPTD
jgi:hypothetical protein